MLRTPIVVLLLAGGMGAACSVPNVVFDGGQDTNEGGPVDAMTLVDATLDDVVDAGSDGGPDSPADATNETSEEAAPTCALPADDASVCCGAVVCQGDCNVGNCSTCESKCTAAQVCCVKGTAITCHLAGTTCP